MGKWIRTPARDNVVFSTGGEIWEVCLYSSKKEEWNPSRLCKLLDNYVDIWCHAVKYIWKRHFLSWNLHQNKHYFEWFSKILDLLWPGNLLEFLKSTRINFQISRPISLINSVIGRNWRISFLYRRQVTDSEMIMERKSKHIP